jgi:hypothetical protein
MPSAEFRSLESAIKRLKRHFLLPLPGRPAPHGEQVYAKSMAFRVLACGEIEFYYEKRALRVAKKAKAGNYPSVTNNIIMASMIAGYTCGFKSDDDDVEVNIPNAPKHYSKDKYQEFLDRALDAYGKVVDNNHGVKVRNLKRIAKPVAVDIDEFDSTFTSTLNSYAAQRGEIAHKGISVRMRLDPADEISKIDALIEFVKTHDAVFDAARGGSSAAGGPGDVTEPPATPN